MGWGQPHQPGPPSERDLAAAIRHLAAEHGDEALLDAVAGHLDPRDHRNVRHLLAWHALRGVAEAIDRARWDERRLGMHKAWRRFMTCEEVARALQVLPARLTDNTRADLHSKGHRA